MPIIRNSLVKLLQPGIKKQINDMNSQKIRGTWIEPAWMTLIKKVINKRLKRGF